MNPAHRVDGIIEPAKRKQILESMDARETTCDGEGDIYGRCWYIESEGETWVLDQWAYASYRAHCLTCEETSEPSTPPPENVDSRDPSACVLGGLILVAIALVFQKLDKK